jgi:serine/threonine-protein kinase
VPAAVDSIVLVAMAKNPVNRFASAAEMRADIDRALAGRPVHANPVQRADDPAASALPPTTVLLREPPTRRRGAAYALLAIATIAVFVIALVVARNLLGGSTHQVTTPDLTGESYSDAQATLAAQGLSVGTVTSKYTGKNDKGTVIAQDPPGGILVHNGYPVQLVISGGIRFVAVPTGLVGLSEDQARSALAAAGLRVGRVVFKNSPVPVNQVLGSQPAEGSSVAAGSKVTLVVSNSRVKVPDVTLDDVATATAVLQQAGFNVPPPKRAAVYHRRNDGLVVSQSPVGGSFAPSGSDVTIYVDEKPPPSTTSPSPSSSPGTSPTPSATVTVTPF